MTNKEEGMRILEKVERGEVNVADAIGTLARKDSEDAKSPTTMELLEALEHGEISADQAIDRLGSQNEKAIPEMKDSVSRKNTYKHSAKRGRVWLLPLWAGVGFVLLSASWMASRLQSVGTDFWFFAAWLLLALGVLLISLTWASRNSPWLTLKIRSSNNEGLRRLNLHFPLPSGILSWAINRYKGRLTGVNIDELESIVAAMGPLTDPIVIHTIDDDDGEEVEIIIT